MDHPVTAAGEHRRTDEERKDQRLSWVRSDRAFFAAGACHILAYVRFSGWHLVGELLAANEAFEGRRLELVEIAEDLEDFCVRHSHRHPDQFYADPVERARHYVRLFTPPFPVRG